MPFENLVVLVSLQKMTIGAILRSACPGFLRAYVEELRASPLASRLSRGAFWSLLGAAVSRSLNLVGAIIIARILGKQSFGELGIVQNTVTTFQVFAGAGLAATATRYVAQLRGQDPARAGRILALSAVTAFATGVLCAAGLYVAAPLLSGRTLAASHLADPLRIGAGLLFFTSLNGAQLGAMAGLEAFKTMARVNLVSGAATLLFTMAGALTGGLTGILWGLLAGMAVTWLITSLSLRSAMRAAGIRLQVLGCWNERAVLWTFSLPAVLAGVLVAVATWGTNAILVNQHGGYAEMGAYNAVLRIKQVPEGILAALLAPVLPILAGAHSRRETRTFEQTTRFAFALSIVIVIPLALLQISLPALSLLPFGPEFRGYLDVVRWLMIQTIIMGVCYPIGIIVMAAGRMWIGTIYNLFWAITFVAFAVMLVPRHFGAGLAASFAMAYVVSIVPLLVYLYRREADFLGNTPFWRVLLGMLALSVCLWLVGAFAQPLVAAVPAAISMCFAVILAYRILGHRTSAKESPSLDVRDFSCSR